MNHVKPALIHQLVTHVIMDLSIMEIVFPTAPKVTMEILHSIQTLLVDLCMEE
jgi:hypothetical protein